MSTFVYFVRAAGVGPIKIGHSGAWERRVRALQTSQAGRLDVVLVVLGSREVEQALHTQFAEHRLEGEWFTPAPELLRFMAEHADCDVRKDPSARLVVDAGKVTRLTDPMTPARVRALWAVIGALELFGILLENEERQDLLESVQARGFDLAELEAGLREARDILFGAEQ